MSVGVERLIETYIKYKLIRKGAVLIEGPKCVGKSFSCERLSKSKILLKSDLNFIARVREVLDFALVGEFPRFIGEWQYCPFLWEEIKNKIDTLNSENLYILSGSSTPTEFSERHDGAGRFATIEMENLTLQEMELSNKRVDFLNLFIDGFNVKKVQRNSDSNTNSVQKNFEWICKGGFAKNFIQNYNETESINENKDYIKQICRCNKRDVKNTVLFSFSKTIMEKVFYELSRNLSKEINIVAMSGRLAISRDTLSKYIDILENMYILKKIHSWRPHIMSNSDFINSPKYYLFDPCLAVAMLNTNSLELINAETKLLNGNWSNYDDAGFFFEAQVIKQLRIFSTLTNSELMFYRDTNKLEIDAIVKYKNKIAVFEIKIGSIEGINFGTKNINSFRKILSETEKKNITSWNIIVATAETYYNEKENVNIISINDLYLNEDYIK